jgi:hypothetical protein
MALRRRAPDSSEQAANATRRALLVCNGTFDDPELPSLVGVAKDHDRVSAVLRGPSARFEVTAVLDAGFLDVRKAIAKLCADSDEEDTLLFYYSGGSFRGRDGCLYLPVRDSSKQYADSTTLDTDFILRHLRQSRCRKIILMVDGCNAGAFFEQNRGIPNGLYAIMATSADATTADTPEGGAFTRAIVDALNDPKTDVDGDGQISIDELFECAKCTLVNNGCKSPPQKWIWNVDGPIYIASAPANVFLSYARKDVDNATKLKQELEKRGFGVWMDLEGIKAGNYKTKVTDGLNKSRCVILLMTEHSLTSESVQKELEFAAGKNVPLIPVCHREWPDAKLPDWYRFDYGPIHRRVLTAEAASFDELATAIKSVRPE